MWVPECVYCSSLKIVDEGLMRGKRGTLGGELQAEMSPSACPLNIKKPLSY